MLNELVNFSIEKIILHQIFDIPIDKDNKDTPILSNTLASIDESKKNTLRLRVTKALNNQTHCLEMKLSATDSLSTCKYVRDAICTDGFIEASKEIAKILDSKQTRRNIPGGILTILRGQTGSSHNDFICIIKAELDSGCKSVSNITTLDFDIVENIFLSSAQRLYKIGIFIKESNNPKTMDYKIFVYDHNMRTSNPNEAADYFYRDFLGCTIMPNSKNLTRDFYEYTKTYINNLEISDIEKNNYQMALHTYLKVNKKDTLSIGDFSEEYFSDEISDEYTNFMRAKKFPEKVITKDIELLKRKLSNRTLKSTSNVRITVPSNCFDDVFQIVGYDKLTDKTSVNVKGRIREQ